MRLSQPFLLFGALISTVGLIYISPWIPKVKYYPVWLKLCLNQLFNDILSVPRHFNTREQRLVNQHDYSSKSELNFDLAPRTTLLSIVIPVYNDGKNILFDTLTDLHQKKSNLKNLNLEVVVVDGGCKDDTMSAVTDFKAYQMKTNKSKHGFSIKSVKLEKSNSEFGRGAALKKGSLHVSSDSNILIFMHCDVQLPQDFDSLIFNILSKSHNFFCFFRFQVKNSTKTAMLNFMTNLRSKYFLFPYGDQTFCILTKNYKRLKFNVKDKNIKQDLDANYGFRSDYRLMEDVEFLVRVRNYCFETGYRMKLLDESCICSNRRWAKVGYLKVTLLNWAFIFGMMNLNISPNTLYTWYYSQ